jgi:hypothetical protein
VVIVLALLIGGALLVIPFDDSGRNDGIELGGGADDDTAETTAPATAAVAGDAEPPAAVPVYVANGSGAAGRAQAVTEQLRSVGYTTALEPGGDTGATPTSQVFYLPDWDAEAQAVAVALGLGAERIMAWPEPPPFPPPFGGTVIVQLGADLAA